MFVVLFWKVLGVRAVSNAGWWHVRLSDFNRIIGESRSLCLLCHMFILFCLIVNNVAILSSKCALYVGWQCTLQGWGVASADVWDARWYITHPTARVQVSMDDADGGCAPYCLYVTQEGIKVPVWRSTLCPASPSSPDRSYKNKASYIYIYIYSGWSGWSMLNGRPFKDSAIQAVRGI